MDVARVADLEKTDIPGTVIVGGDVQTVIV
jgi:hypothetical protein